MAEPKPEKKPEALVEGVITGDGDGPDGVFYFVKIEKPPNCPRSLSQTLEVTFAEEMWRDGYQTYPQVSQRVRLGHLREFDKGWRALWAEPITYPENKS